jgi:hypothetical protein
MSRRVGLTVWEELGGSRRSRGHRPTEGDAARYGGTVHRRFGRKPKVTLDGGGRRK